VIVERLRNFFPNNRDDLTKVGRCSFTPGWKHFTPRLLSVLETKM